MTVQDTDALVIVDVQNTFCPGGTLPVKEGDTIVEPINRIMPLFAGHVYASQDWHPADHCSFVTQGGIWPVHAVQNTEDAALHPALNREGITVTVLKGTRSDADAYSAFDGTGLAERLWSAGIRRVFVTGLATDYCVKATALDARAAHFETVALTDAMRAVDVHLGDGDAAITAMREAGITTATTDSLTR